MALSAQPKEESGESTELNLPPLPDESEETGVLPKVIKSLVQRRKQVKSLMKKESNTEKYEEVRFLFRHHVKQLGDISNTFSFSWISSKKPSS
jgi:DNA polymerase elongation subunit (family B)